MKIATLLPLVTLVVAGCAQKPATVTLDKPIRTLGVASNCGATMTREALAWFKVGLDDHTTMDVRGWGLDASIKRLVEVRTGGAVTSVDIHANLPAIMSWRGESWFGGPTYAEMLRAAIEVPPQQVDAYLLYTEGRYGENSNITGPQSVNTRYGIGLFSRMALKVAHVECNAILVDATTFKPLHGVTVNQTEPFESDLNLDRWEDYTPEQLARVRKMLTGLWEKGITEVVDRMPLRAPRS